MVDFGDIDIKLTASGLKDVIAAMDSLVTRVSELEGKLTTKTSAEQKKRTADAKAEEKKRAADARAEQKKLLDAQKSDAKELELVNKRLNSEIEKDRKKSAADALRSEKTTLAERKRMYQDFGTSVMSSMRGILSMGARIGGGLLALGGGFAIADSVKGQMHLDKSAALYAANVPGASRSQFTNIVNAEAVKTNTSQDEIAEGLNAFRKSAGTDKAAMGLDLIHDANLAAKITGESISTIMTSLGDAAKEIPGFTTEMGHNLTEYIVGLQKAGIDVAQATEMLPRTVATARKFGGPLGANLTEIGALQALGGKAVAPGMLDRALDNALKSKEGGKIGLTPGMSIRDIALKMSGLSIAESEKITGRGENAFLPLQEANRMAGGGAAGAAAAMELFDKKLRDLAEQTDLQKQASEAMTNFEDEWGSVIKQIEIQLGTSLLGVLKEHKTELITFVEKIGQLAITALPLLLTAATQLANVFGYLAGSDIGKAAANHPFLAIGTAMAAQTLGGAALQAGGKATIRGVAGLLSGSTAAVEASGLAAAETSAATMNPIGEAIALAILAGLGVYAITDLVSPNDKGDPDSKSHVVADKIDQLISVTVDGDKQKLKAYQNQKNDPTMGPIYNKPTGTVTPQYDAAKEAADRAKIIQAAEAEHIRVAAAIKAAWLKQIGLMQPPGPRGAGGAFEKPGT